MNSTGAQPGRVRADALAEFLQRRERCLATLAHLLVRIIQTRRVFHGHQHRQRMVISGDEEALTRGRLIEDATQGASEIERRDRLHAR